MLFREKQIMAVEKRFQKNSISNGKIRVTCKICQSEKWAKVISKFTQECKSEWEEWKEEKVRVRVLPHQRGKGQCSGSNKTQIETLSEIVWV